MPSTKLIGWKVIEQCFSTFKVVKAWHTFSPTEMSITSTITGIYAGDHNIAVYANMVDGINGREFSTSVPSLVNLTASTQPLD